MKHTKHFFTLLFLTFLISCNKKDKEYQKLKEIYTKPPKQWVKPFIDEDLDWKELGLLPAPNYPKEKPSKKLIELGKKLFFEVRLSQSKQIACASCHHPDQNWTDNRRISMGNSLLEGARNAPSVLNLSYAKHFFWDGRANSLEQQLEGPLTSSVEMNTSLDTVVARINNIKGYRKLFNETLNKKNIALKDIAYAIATFERSLISRKSKFDYFLLGKKQLSEKELKGLHLFRTKARCINCHNGPLFTDGKFHNVGLTYYGRSKYEDLGRYLVTGKKEDVGKFKTPSLRDVIFTKPWMHNGLFDNMNGIITMYSNGMPRPKRNENQKKDTLFPSISPIIKKLHLTKSEKECLVAFLHTISAPSFKIKKPILPN